MYYDQFATYFDENLSYSYEEFQEEFHRFKNIGFTTACSVMPNILSDKAIDIQGNPITAFRELQRKQVCLRKLIVGPVWGNYFIFNSTLKTENYSILLEIKDFSSKLWLAFPLPAYKYAKRATVFTVETS